MKTTSRPAAKSKVAKPTRDAFVRLAASSTAVETGRPIGKIERALRATASSAAYSRRADPFGQPGEMVTRFVPFLIRTSVHPCRKRRMPFVEW
ncbi:hypothetical protein [Rhodanobacter terrae]|uniref:Uncharacterized protein n=1 Tax=Rhodanobacter terrae TaxID=418647 RepID=A0ABW0SUY8_9GAMM